MVTNSDEDVLPIREAPPYGRYITRALLVVWTAVSLYWAIASTIDNWQLLTMSFSADSLFLHSGIPEAFVALVCTGFAWRHERIGGALILAVAVGTAVAIPLMWNSSAFSDLKPEMDGINAIMFTASLALPVFILGALVERSAWPRRRRDTKSWAGADWGY